HFGQQLEAETCGACDICLGEIEFEAESTTVAQKILSCVARVEQRFGIGHVADVLRGETTERTTRHQHNQLSTFGLLRDQRERDVKGWIAQLVSDGLLDQTTDEFPVLKLNDASWRVLRGQQHVRLIRTGRATTARKSRAEEVSWEGVNSQLFDALRA